MHTSKVLATAVSVMLAICILLPSVQACQLGCNCGIPGCNCGGTGQCASGSENTYEQPLVYGSPVPSPEETPTIEPCPDRSNENKILVQGSQPPNCQYRCIDGYTMVGDVCTPCSQYCAAQQKIPDPSDCKGGACACIGCVYEGTDPNVVLVPGSYPPDNCQWVCKDGYGPDGGVCTKCTDICAKDPHKIPDPSDCTGGECKCICDSTKGYRINDQGVCACEDGSGTDAGGACAKCTDICAKDNKISTANSVGGVCDCTCDTKNGYHLDEKTGKCVSEITDKLIDALNANNDPQKMLDALVPDLLSNNQRTRILAAVGIISIERTNGSGTIDKYTMDSFKQYVQSHHEDLRAIQAIISLPKFTPRRK